jgi:bifunctional non-homologous end joining protein LigD
MPKKLAKGTKKAQPLKSKKRTIDAVMKTCTRARKAAMPGVIHPMLATLVDEPFSHPDWVFETKWDGFRAICFWQNGKSRLMSRNQLDMTHQYPELVGLPRQVKAKKAILDGEIVALDEHGMPRFQLLQPRVGRKRQSDIEALIGKAKIVYYVFDLLYIDGYDLMPCPLVERKAMLERILRSASFVKFSEHIEGEGERFFREIEKFHLEGMVAKKANSQYVQRRSTDWLKVKTVLRSEVVIGGYTQPRGSRSYFGALVVGLYRDGQLYYVAHVGGGFNQLMLAHVYKLMQPLKTRQCPFVDPPKTNEPVQWVRPKLVAEVKFSEWTAEHHLRHPIFVGLREDKKPEECTFEFERDADKLIS